MQKLWLRSFNFNNLLAAQSSVIFYVNNFTNKLKLAVKLILDINKYRSSSTGGKELGELIKFDIEVSSVTLFPTWPPQMLL